MEHPQNENEATTLPQSSVSTERDDAPQSTTVETESPLHVHTGDERKNLECRFYENDFPPVGSLVMVTVRNITNTGVYVSLPEYDDKDGLIPIPEVSRSRIRTMNAYLRVNRNEVCVVIGVNRERGYIDLSKKRVSFDDVTECRDRFCKAKAVHGVLRHVAERRGLNLEGMYKTIAWPLYRKYGHAFDAFKLAILFDGQEDKDPFSTVEIPSELKGELREYAALKLAPKPTKVRSDVEVTCFAEAGVDGIREALLAGMALSKGNTKVDIRLVAAPLYTITAITVGKDEGIELIKEVIEVVGRKIMEKGGKIDVKMVPKAVTADEERELRQLMKDVLAESEIDDW